MAVSASPVQPDTLAASASGAASASPGDLASPGLQRMPAAPVAEVVEAQAMALEQHMGSALGKESARAKA